MPTTRAEARIQQGLASKRDAEAHAARRALIKDRSQHESDSLKAIKRDAQKTTKQLQRKAPRSRSAFGAGVCLPEAALHIIMECVADLEPGGVRGPSSVARNLASAATVCRDFRYAAAHGFAVLAQRVQQQLSQCLLNHPLYQLYRLPGRACWAQWDKIISNPLAFSRQELRDAAASVGRTISGTTKPQVVLQVLQIFNLSAPCCVPAELLAVVAGERNKCIIEDAPKQVCTPSTSESAPRTWLRDNFHEPLRAMAALSSRGAKTLVNALSLGYTRHSVPISGDGGLAKIRAELIAAGITSLEALKQLVIDKEARFEEEKRAGAAARWEAHQQRIAEQQAAA